MEVEDNNTTDMETVALKAEKSDHTWKECIDSSDLPSEKCNIQIKVENGSSTKEQSETINTIETIDTNKVVEGKIEIDSSNKKVDYIEKEGLIDVTANDQEKIDTESEKGKLNEVVTVGQDSENSTSENSTAPIEETSPVAKSDDHQADVIDITIIDDTPKDVNDDPDVIIVEDSSMMDYREKGNVVVIGDSSDSSPDSSSEDEEADKETTDQPEEDTGTKINKIISSEKELLEKDKRVKLNRYGFEDIRTKGELLPEDLPPLEELTITVDESVMMEEVGAIKSIVGVLVVIQSVETVKPLNDETILFLDGHKVLGQVFEVFGPVKTPWYSVRFNEADNITGKGLEVGMKVYCAPREDAFTKFVFVDNLRDLKGSDASWEDNNEPPVKHLDYSDDESEKRAKAKRRGKKVGATQGDGQDEATEGVVEKKNKRNKNRSGQNRDGEDGFDPGNHGRNPFQGGNMSGHNNHNPRFTRGVTHQGGPWGQRWPPGPSNNFNRPPQQFGGRPEFQNVPRFFNNNQGPNTGFNLQSMPNGPQNQNFNNLPNNGNQNSGQRNMPFPAGGMFGQGPPNFGQQQQHNTPAFGQQNGFGRMQDFSRPPPSLQAPNQPGAANQTGMNGGPVRRGLSGPQRFGNQAFDSGLQSTPQNGTQTTRFQSGLNNNNVPQANLFQSQPNRLSGSQADTSNRSVPAYLNSLSGHGNPSNQTHNEQMSNSNSRETRKFSVHSLNPGQARKNPMAQTSNNMAGPDTNQQQAFRPQNTTTGYSSQPGFSVPQNFPPSGMGNYNHGQNMSANTGQGVFNNNTSSIQGYPSNQTHGNFSNQGQGSVHMQGPGVSNQGPMGVGHIDGREMFVAQRLSGDAQQGGSQTTGLNMFSNSNSGRSAIIDHRFIQNSPNN